MQATHHPPSPEPDEHALEKSLRQARLEQLTLETQRTVAASRQAVAAHLAARARMADAVQEARARIRTLAHAGAESGSMDSLTFHKSPHPQVSP